MTPAAKQNRTDFDAYLKGMLPAGEDPAKYSRNLDSKIKSFYKNKLHKDFGSLFDIVDDNAVYGIKQDIVSHPGLVYQRGRSGDSRIEGLGLYIKYLNAEVTPPSVSTSTRRIKLASPEMEGKHITREQVVIQRNITARQKCIEYYQCRCAACGLSMAEKYGKLGDGVIEVHHLNPIHLFSDTHKVDYKEDLVALCPNCHTMIHKLDDHSDLAGLKQLIEENWHSKC